MDEAVPVSAGSGWMRQYLCQQAVPVSAGSGWMRQSS